MNRKTLALPALMGLLAPVLAACGTTPGARDGGSATVVGTTDRFVVDSGTPAPFDPAFAYDTGARNVLRQTVQTLTHVPRGGGRPVPEAASRCEFTDSRSEGYRCVLRDGLTFAGGRPVTAEDVTFSIERVPDITSDSGTAALLSTVDTVEARSEKEIVFHLSAPDAAFPYELSTPVAGILSRDACEVDRLREGFQVDGSGPYTMAAETDGGRLVRAVFTENEAGVATPVKLTLHHTTDHYGSGTAKEFAALRDQLNATDLFSMAVKGAEWPEYRPAQKRGDCAVYGLGWFLDFPDPDDYLAPLLDEDDFLNTPYVSAAARNQLIPESRRKADRSAAALPFARFRDIVATDVPVLPLWQGKRYVAARSDVNGVEWTLNASSDLQLRELERGTA
ncbi:ABC transporter substrate-binding protein [Streptomyces marianii]|uniref:Peptide-binding protein n=1 Tax=Streptomyces marianii TaxID=1817406 RepID=A0A5R9E9U4_9ACTN|nr:ABC transporter substrate-binding protein [Streptomyces marianii]TLQ46891.1 peptide-binding protein [Streptomyces marianii]